MAKKKKPTVVIDGLSQVQMALDIRTAIEARFQELEQLTQAHTRLIEQSQETVAGMTPYVELAERVRKLEERMLFLDQRTTMHKGRLNELKGMNISSNMSSLGRRLTKIEGMLSDNRPTNAKVDTRKMSPTGRLVPNLPSMPQGVRLDDVAVTPELSSEDTIRQVENIIHAGIIYHFPLADTAKAVVRTILAGVEERVKITLKDAELDGPINDDLILAVRGVVQTPDS